jgi:Ca2+-binding RTX toxin-like protein
MRRLLAVIAIAAAGLLPIPATAQIAPPECFGKTATIVGTEGDDTLSGTTGTDVIAALDGTDTILGWHDPEATYPHVPALPDEMDYICGGANAGEGGGGDADEDLWGGYGRDRIAGGGGADFLRGGNGNDVLMGGSSQDAMYGEGGHDRIYGEGGDEVYHNHLRGGPGDDYLEGRLGAKDSFYGGSGYDTCVMGPEDLTFRDQCEEIIQAT